MQKNHKELCARGQIKIFNGSILDLKTKIKEFCFVVGMEILDNMPHDRLYTESFSNSENGDPSVFSHYSTVDLSYKAKEEFLEEKLVSLKDNPDALISLFLRLQKSLPELDSIQAKKRLASEGLAKRIIDLFRDSTRKKTKETT